MRQGNDVGTQYRSAIYTTTPEQLATAERVRDEFQTEFTRSGFGRITTEIKPAPDFFYAEDYHQQYLDKNPRGYCPCTPPASPATERRSLTGVRAGTRAPASSGRWRRRCRTASGRRC